MVKPAALERAEGSGPNLKGIINLQRVAQDGHAKRQWTAGESSDISEGGRLVVDLDETSIGIFRVEGKLYAYVNVCLHMGGPACQGKILPRVLDVLDDGKKMLGQTWDESDPHVVCPWHGFEYSIKTGQHAGRPSIALKAVQVEEAEGQVYVTI
jgi:nitrite reductase/ring-hydroxylating ferredoxin subunit